MMKRVLVASKACRSALPADELIRRFRAAGLEADLASIADARASGTIGACDAVVAGTEFVGDEVLDLAPSLRLVQKFGVGLDAIDIDAARARKVAVRNLPAVNSGAVAEMTFALMISLARRVAEGDRAVRAGTWPRLLGATLRGKVLGVAGTGAIGCELARLTSGFGMCVLGYDVCENDAFLAAGGSYVSFEELLAKADVLSLHVPLTESTRHMVGEAELARMKPEAFLVNTSRGGIVDESALYEALSSGAVAGAALDVLESEPASESPLTTLGNVVVTPHIAAYEAETLALMVDRCVASVSEFFSSDEGGEG